MRIIKLEVSNVKRIVALAISPTGNLIVIGGENGVGKSTVLDSIMYALGGMTGIPTKPLRDGAQSGSIIVELDCDLIVKRTFTESGGGTLTLMNQDGAQYPSPQSRLDKLIGKLSFDPLEFSRMKPKEQLETLRQVVGIDFTELDADRAKIYELRATYNKKVQELEGQIAGMPQHEDVPYEMVSILQLTEALSLATAMQEGRAALRSDIDSLQTRRGEQCDLIAKAQKQIEAWKQKLDGADESVRTIDKQIAEKSEALDQAEEAAPETQPILDQMAAAEQTNEKIRQNRDRADKIKEAQGFRDGAVGQTGRINQIDRDKAALVSDTTFPVGGLGFGSEGVLLNGLPFEQASQAEQIRVSVAMGIALNPELRVLLIRDGSLLDEKSLALVAQMAEEHDAQVWLERVSEDSEIVIEDGTVPEPEDEDG